MDNAVDVPRAQATTDAIYVFDRPDSDTGDRGKLGGVFTPEN
jgi:hypothetical protein